MRIRSLLLPTFPVAVALSIGCGGAAPATEKTTPGAGSGGNETSLSGDSAVNVPSAAINGVLYVAKAIDRPPISIVEPKKKITVEKISADIEKEKDPENREVQSQILATMLYQMAKAEKDQTKAAAMYEDARTVLRKAVTKNGKAVDSITLQMLGTLDLLKADYTNAEQSWGARVAMNPKAKDVNESRTWWAFSLLRLNKPAEALSALGDLKPSKETPEAAYISAWAKLLASDEAGAWQDILKAAQGWKLNSTRPILEDDFVRFAGRTTGSLDEAAGAATLFGPTKADEYQVLFKIALQYSYGGRHADQIAAIDKAIAAAGDKLPKTDLPALRNIQMQASVRVDDPDKTAAIAKLAVDAITQCGDACKKNAEDLRGEVKNVGTLYHSLFVTSEDQRYHAPARELYAQAGRAGDTSKELATQIASLETAKANIEKRKAKGALGGVHDARLMQHLIGLHNPEVSGCFEFGLAASPGLGGGLALMLEVDHKGTVTGATTNPAVGAGGLPAVASCVVERARAWRFPARGSAGVTRVNAKYELSQKN